MKSPGPEVLGQARAHAVKAAAKAVGVSVRSIENAKVVLDEGTPELIAAVKAGEVTVSAAAKRARATKMTAIVPAAAPMIAGTEAAKVIGALYHMSRRSLVESVHYAIECGQRLAEVKSALGHSKWIPWLRDNADALGFDSRRTAARLMKLAETAEANGTLASQMDPDTALAASRELWGHDKTPGQLVNQSNSNCWYTPAEYVGAARLVLGGIDLDPASSAEANETVRAARFYTEADDGLAQPWSGRVFLNPPYGGLAGGFVARAVEEYSAGRVVGAVIVLNSHCTDTAWFQPLWDHLLCFTNHRINFHAGEGQGVSGSINGTVFVYLGRDVAAFVTEFSRFGACVARVRP